MRNNITTSWTVLRIASLSLRVDRRIGKVSGLLLLLLAFLCLSSLSYGDYHMSFSDTIKALLQQANPSNNMVMWQLRLPRVLVALLVGIALGVAGALLQGLTRNPLADPGIIGINQGASVAAVAVMVWFDNVPIHYLPPVAFVGGSLTALLIYIFAWKNGSSPMRLVLVGIGFASLLGAITTIMVVFSDIDQVSQAYVWLSGSVYGRGWGEVSNLIVWLAILLPLAYLYALPMNALMQDDNTIKAIGVNIEKTRLILILISVALASVSVSAAGIFSFLGLVAPHISRLLIGSTYQGLIIVTALVGACIVVGADFIGRIIIAPNQIPAGLITAIIGAPYFFWQMRNKL
ncbi:MAG: iron ABC transporter permease [Moraxellaceae bacterium]|nr:iron ABC transporter permease [Moraxellaceae bacterium]